MLHSSDSAQAAAQTSAPDQALHQEGLAQFQVGNAFFRPESRLARDLGLLAAAVYRAETGRLRVLETMAGCGIRALRYSLEAGADFVWTNDANPDLAPLLQANLSHNLTPDRYRLTQQRAAQPLAQCCAQQDFYDLVDIDAFGSAAPFMAAALGAVALGGLIYLTATDARLLAGRAPESSLRAYGVCARIHPSCQEQGLRLLLGGLWQQASVRGFGIEPIFSYFSGQTYRVMVRLLSRPGSQHQGPEQRFGFLGYCHDCGEYQTVGWRKLSRARCRYHEPPRPLTLSGPLWLGPLHSPSVIARMQTQAQTWQWQAPARVLAVMAAEAELPPYHFPLGELGRWGRLDPPKRDRLIQALQHQGYAASPTHLSPQAFKTNASLHHCIALANSLAPSDQLPDEGTESA